MPPISVGGTRPPVTLQSLPFPVLQQIVAHVLIEDKTRAIECLTQYERSLHDATCAVLLRNLVLYDDDAVLVETEQGPPDSNKTTVMTKVMTNKQAAAQVKSLTILPAPRLAPLGNSVSCDAPPSPTHTYRSHGESVQEDCGTRTLDESHFLLLISRLSNLQHLAWRTTRMPPPQLCLALGTVCRTLTHLVLEPLDDPDISHGSPFESPGKRVTSSNRWNAPSLACLGQIDTLVQLTVGHLSQQGSKQLAISMASLGLEALEVGDTLFVDDALLASIGATAKRLKRLRIYDMPGGKLTDAGIEAVLSGCTSLAELELDCVEGRLSKTCWSKIEQVPDALKILRIVYSDVGPHKSWVLDHLISLPDFVATATALSKMYVVRKPHPEALIPGQHAYAVFAVDPMLAFRPLPTPLLHELVKKGSGWQELGLDLFCLDLGVLKKIMEVCTNLRKLQVAYEGDFKTLLNAPASFALCTNLRQFVVSIDPERAGNKAPQIQLPFTPAQSPESKRPSLPSVSTTPMQMPDSPPRTRKGASAISGTGSTSSSGHAVKHGDDIPSLKEWRKFLKKSHRLVEVRWGGRGGVGTWRFDREKGGSLGTKVEFEPMVPSKEDSSSVFGSGELVTIAAARTNARRESAVSLEGTPLENLVPVEPELCFGAMTTSSQQGYRAIEMTRSGSIGAGYDGLGLGLAGLSIGTDSTGTPRHGNVQYGLSPSPLTTGTPPESPAHSPTRAGRRPSGASAMGSLPSSTPSGASSTSAAQSSSPPPIVYPGGWRSAKKDKERNERRKNKGKAAAAGGKDSSPGATGNSAGTSGSAASVRPSVPGAASMSGASGAARRR